MFTGIRRCWKVSHSAVKYVIVNDLCRYFKASVAVMFRWRFVQLLWSVGNRHQGSYVFALVCLFVCLLVHPTVSVSRIAQRSCIYFREIFRSVLVDSKKLNSCLPLWDSAIPLSVVCCDLCDVDWFVENIVLFIKLMSEIRIMLWLECKMDIVHCLLYVLYYDFLQ